MASTICIPNITIATTSTPKGMCWWKEIQHTKTDHWPLVCVCVYALWRRDIVRCLVLSRFFLCVGWRRRHPGRLPFTQQHHHQIPPKPEHESTDRVTDVCVWMLMTRESRICGSGLNQKISSSWVGFGVCSSKSTFSLLLVCVWCFNLESGWPRSIGLQLLLLLVCVCVRLFHNGRVYRTLGTGSTKRRVWLKIVRASWTSPSILLLLLPCWCWCGCGGLRSARTRTLRHDKKAVEFVCESSHAM